MDTGISFGRLKIGLVLIGLALAVASLLFPGGALAADGGLEVLQVGWDGNVVPGTWSPVRVRLAGGSADLNVRVEVVLRNRIQTGPQTAAIEYPVGAYGQELALPAGVAKEVTLWVPADPGMGGPAMVGSVLLSAEGQILAEQRVEFKSTRAPLWPLVGVLAEAPSVARAISQVELPMQGLPVPLSVARLSPADLPVSAELLRALSVLVVQGNAVTTLTGEQRRTLQEWVAGGGHLVLAGGPDAARTMAALPAGSLPVTFAGADSAVDLAPLARWAGAREIPPGDGPAARFQAAAGSLLAGPPDRPLAWRLALGQGDVTLLAPDPGLEPLAGWAGTPALFMKALEPALPDPADNEKMLYIAYEANNPLRLQSALEALPPEAYPSWQTVALILGGFALLVGPLLHLLLSRADRRAWVWVAVPGAAVALSGALYYAGIGRGGQDVLVNVVSHLRLDADTGQGRQLLAAGFFAPTHPELSVTVPGDDPVRAVGRSDPLRYGPMGPIPDSAPTEAPFRVLAGRNTRVEFPSGQWNMRSVVLNRTLRQEAGRITSNLALEGGLIRGSLRNDTPYPLEDAAVIVGQNLVKLGNLAPGQTAQVVLDPGSPANPLRGGFPLSWRLFGRPPGSGGGGQVMYGPGVLMPAPAPAVAVAVAPMKLTPTPVRAVPPSPPGDALTPTPATSPTPAATRTPAPTRSALAATVAPGSAPPGMPERLELPQDPEVQRRVRLMDPVLNVPRAGPGMPMMPLTFVAFTRAPVGRDLPSAGDHPAYHLTLLEQPLRLELPPGPFTMPSALAPAQILTQSGGFGGGSNGTVSWIQLQGGSSITYGFRLPLPARGKVEALLITTQQMGSPASFVPGRGMPPPSSATPDPAEAGLFSLYNWQSAAWDPLPGGQDQTRVEPASAYVGPDGLVKLQATAPVDKTVNVVQPEISAEGTVGE